MRAFQGRLLRRGEPGYEEARVGRIFNARRPERYPEEILFAASEEDVVQAVRSAAQRGGSVSVRASSVAVTASIGLWPRK